MDKMLFLKAQKENDLKAELSGFAKSRWHKAVTESGQEDIDCQVLRWFSGKITGHMSNSYLPICQLLPLVRLLTSWAFAFIQYCNFCWLCGVLFLPVERDMNYQNNFSLSVVQCVFDVFE